MRIVFAVNNYPPRVGGLEAHVSNLATHLAGQGHEVVVHALTQESSASVSSEAGVEVHRWPEMFSIGGVLGLPTPRAAVGLWRALVGSGADLLSTHTRFFPLTWLGVAAGRRAKVPVLHTEHGSDHIASPSPVIRWGARMVDLTLGRLALRRATAVVGVSDEVVAFVRRLSGVEASVFANAIVAPDADLRRDPRAHLVFVGRIVAGKGWEDFLDVVAGLGDVTAEVLGDGADLPALRERAASMGLGERLVIRGRVPMTEVYAALAGAVLVNPTRLSEGFQTTLLEALAVGGRVVTYPVPGAALLADSGAPIRVVPRSSDALLDGVRAALASDGVPWTAEQLQRWTWPSRSREYATLAQRTVDAD